MGGKLAAEVICNRALGNPDAEIKAIPQHIIDAASSYASREPLGVKGDGAIAFGGGATLTKQSEDLLKEIDPSQFLVAAGAAS